MKKWLPWALALGLTVAVCIAVYKSSVPSDLSDLVTDVQQCVSRIDAKSEERGLELHADYGSWKTIYVNNGTREQYKFIVPKDVWDVLEVGDVVTITLYYIDDELYDVKYGDISCFNTIEIRDNPVVQREFKRRN